MKLDTFKWLTVGKKVATCYGARTRTVTHVYDDPSGARILSLSAINGCTASITNLETQTGPNEYHYSRAAIR